MYWFPTAAMPSCFQYRLFNFNMKVKQQKIKSKQTKIKDIAIFTKQFIKEEYGSIIRKMKRRKEKILIIDKSILYAMGLKSYLKSYPVLKKFDYEISVNMLELNHLNTSDCKFIFIDFDCFKECIMYFRTQNNIPDCCIVLTFLGECIFEPQQLKALGINGSIDKTKTKKEFLEQLVEILTDLEAQKNNRGAANFLIHQRTWLYSSIISENFNFKGKNEQQVFDGLY